MTFPLRLRGTPLLTFTRLKITGGDCVAELQELCDSLKQIRQSRPDVSDYVSSEPPNNAAFTRRQKRGGAC